MRLQILMLTKPFLSSFPSCGVATRLKLLSLRAQRGNLKWYVETKMVKYY